MNRHPVYGIAVPEKQWVPAPSYLLRRERVNRIFESFSAGRILEIGCGAGTMLHELSNRGFAGVGVESSAAAYELACYVNRNNPTIRICPELSESLGSFDYVMALEVLEHIKDDFDALSSWRHHLKPDGRLVLSVPAHSSRWNASDVWAGHYRRYEREGLLGLIGRAGFQLEHIESYGFPLANFIEPIRARYHARQLHRQMVANAGEARKAGNARSGISRSLESRLYPLQASWFGTGLMRLCFLLQSLSSDTNLGTGYLAVAKRA